MQNPLLQTSPYQELSKAVDERWKLIDSEKILALNNGILSQMDSHGLYSFFHSHSYLIWNVLEDRKHDIIFKELRECLPTELQDHWERYNIALTILALEHIFQLELGWL